MSIDVYCKYKERKPSERDILIVIKSFFRATLTLNL